MMLERRQEMFATADYKMFAWTMDSYPDHKTAVDHPYLVRLGPIEEVLLDCT
jgi:hypothetical protein